MQLTEHHAGGHNFVRGFEDDGLRIGDQLFKQSLILAPDQILSEWPPKSAPDIHAEHLHAIFELKPDLVLIGTGLQHVFPAAAVMAAFLQQGIGVEAMDTRAACRTYNVLVSEERRAVAALIL